MFLNTVVLEIYNYFKHCHPDFFLINNHIYICIVNFVESSLMGVYIRLDCVLESFPSESVKGGILSL